MCLQELHYTRQAVNCCTVVQILSLIKQTNLNDKLTNHKLIRIAISIKFGQLFDAKGKIL